MLSKEDFLTAINKRPLVPIDLIIRSTQNAILMGKRINKPTFGCWFVAGGRIFKLETLEDAFSHIYPENFARAPDISTSIIQNKTSSPPC